MAYFVDIINEVNRDQYAAKKNKESKKNFKDDINRNMRNAKIATGAGDLEYAEKNKSVNKFLNQISTTVNPAKYEKDSERFYKAATNNPKGFSNIDRMTDAEEYAEKEASKYKGNDMNKRNAIYAGARHHYLKKNKSQNPMGMFESVEMI